jgi:carbon storage regulator CsrA
MTIRAGVDCLPQFGRIFAKTWRLNKMKEFLQNRGETVVVNGDICVRVLAIHDDKVVLAIDAPEWIEVERKELLEKMEDCIPLLPR